MLIGTALLASVLIALSFVMWQVLRVQIKSDKFPTISLLALYSAATAACLAILCCALWVLAFFAQYMASCTFLILQNAFGKCLRW
jgi:hypothetical protein